MRLAIAITMAANNSLELWGCLLVSLSTMLQTVQGVYIWRVRRPLVKGDMAVEVVSQPILCSIGRGAQSRVLLKNVRPPLSHPFYPRFHYSARVSK